MQVICAWDNRGLLNVCLNFSAAGTSNTVCNDPGFVILSFPVFFFKLCPNGSCVAFQFFPVCDFHPCFSPVSCLSVSTECVFVSLFLCSLPVLPLCVPPCVFPPVFPPCVPSCVPSMCSLCVFPPCFLPVFPPVFPLRPPPVIPLSLFQCLWVSSCVISWHVFCFLFLA